jgi:hypothetical protein
VTFPAPLASDEIHFCLKTMLWVMDKLDSAAIQTGEFGKVKGLGDRFTRGFYRRLEMVRASNSPEGEPRGSKPLCARRPLWDAAVHLVKIAAWSNKGSWRTSSICVISP